MIVSIHISKTAGSSFSVLLKEKFGAKLKFNWEIIPLEMPPLKRHLYNSYLRFKYYYFFNYTDKLNNTECFHGHFMPYQFGFLKKRKDVIFVTWLRDPIEHLISEYYHMKYREPLNKYAEFHRKFLKNNWSLEEFCFRKEMQNFYSNYFLGFSLQNFEFIGITEYFKEDYNYFAHRYLNINPIEIPYENKSSAKKKKKIEDPGLIKAIKEFHKKDYDLYNYALEKRKERLQK